MARYRYALHGALFVAVWLCLAGVQASAGSVKYFNDFLGGLCIREVDLEAAYLEGYKGMRPPPICIEQPCDAKLTRDQYARDILGREPTDIEWETYESTYLASCSDPDTAQAFAILTPYVEPVSHTLPLGDVVYELFAGIQDDAQPDRWHPEYGPYWWWREAEKERDHRDPLFPWGYYLPDTGSGKTSKHGGGTTSTGSLTIVLSDNETGGTPLGTDSGTTAPVPLSPSALALLSALAALGVARLRPR